MSYQEFMELARVNYCKGGAVFYECWEEYQFEEYCQLYGEITRKKAIQMFNRGY